MTKNRPWHLADLVGTEDYEIAERMLERFLFTGEGDPLPPGVWDQFDAVIARKYGFHPQADSP